MTVNTKDVDWQLVKALLEQLKKLNLQKEPSLWTFNGTQTGDILVSTGQKILYHIVQEVGIERLIGIADYGLNAIPNYQIYQENFSNFVGVLDSLIKQHLSIVNYEEAWVLLKGLARFMDNLDPIVFEDYQIIEGDMENIGVRLVQPVRIYLFKIIHVAGLRGMLYDTFYDDVSWNASVEPYQICDEIDFEELCVNITTIESFIRSVTDNWEMFTFDIEELATIEKPRTKMTLEDFLQHECDKYANEYKEK